jgi:hypothetical protein
VKEFGRVSKISYFAFQSRFPTFRDHALDMVAPAIKTDAQNLMHKERTDDPRGSHDPRSALLATLQWGSASALAAMDARIQNGHIPEGFER